MLYLNTLFHLSILKTKAITFFDKESNKNLVDLEAKKSYDFFNLKQKFFAKSKNKLIQKIWI